MKAELDEVTRIGSTAVAAVIVRAIHSHGGAGTPSFYCAKWPLAVLIRHNGVTAAFESNGSRIDADKFERQQPGLRATFDYLASTRLN